MFRQHDVDLGYAYQGCKLPSFPALDLLETNTSHSSPGRGGWEHGENKPSLVLWDHGHCSSWLPPASIPSMAAGSRRCQVAARKEGRAWPGALRAFSKHNQKMHRTVWGFMILNGGQLIPANFILSVHSTEKNVLLLHINI